MTPVNLGPDTVLCTGQSITLNAGAGYDSYLWNNNSVNQTKYVNLAGTYWVKVGKLGTNQVVNGDFEQGATGFTTQYIPGTGGSFGLLTDPGTYAVTSSPSNVHSNFYFCNDHTPNPGTLQMVVNGASTPNTEVWCQTVTTSANTNYQFGTWATSLENTNSIEVADLQFTINGTQIGSVFSPTLTGCSWSQFTTTWNSGITTSAQICIVNQNTSASGNDFAIDDITFAPICYDYDTVIVQYSTPPVVNLGPDVHACATQTVTLDAGNPGMTYAWNDGSATQTIGPTSGGNYSVTVTNEHGCHATDAATVSFESPVGAGNDSTMTICSTTPQSDLTTLRSGGASTAGTWSSTDGNVSPAGLFTTGGSGLYHAIYVVTGTYCPNDTANFEITVNQQPVAASDASFHLCNTSDYDVSFNGSLGSLSGNEYWIFSANTPANTFDPSTKSFDPAGLAADDYSVMLVYPADSMCVNDTTTFTLNVSAMPQPAFSADKLSDCQPVEVTFTDESVTTGSTVYSWDFGNGETASSANANAEYQPAGCFDVQLTLTTDGLCTATLNKPQMICSYEVPAASFYYGPQQVFSDGPTVTFTNTSTEHLSSDWIFGDGLVSDEENPVHDYAPGDIGNYLVTLKVTTDHGCIDTASQVIVVRDQLIYYVPNAFTPDGNEYNNVFSPVMTAGIDAMDYSFYVYDRWGEMLFESHDTQQGWDGSYHGTLVPEGTYTWTIRFGMADTDEIRTDQGHVTLIR